MLCFSRCPTSASSSYTLTMTIKHNKARFSRLAVPLLFLLHSISISASPTSSCYGNSTTLDWYIEAVGETPCTHSFL